MAASFSVKSLIQVFKPKFLSFDSALPVFKDLLLEEGKVAEWEAPCHQYTLVEVEEELEEEGKEEEEGLDGVSRSDKSSCQFGSNHTDIFFNVFQIKTQTFLN